MVRAKGSSPRAKDPVPTRTTGGRGAGGDNENFHITWGPVISLSSMFPSAGKRESQGADNAEGDRNHGENGICNSWEPKDYSNTVSIPQHPVSAQD